MLPVNAVPFFFREDYDFYYARDASNHGHVDPFHGLFLFHVHVRALDPALFPSHVRVLSRVHALARGPGCEIDFLSSYASWHQKDREEFDSLPVECDSSTTMTTKTGAVVGVPSAL